MPEADEPAPVPPSKAEVSLWLGFACMLFVLHAAVLTRYGIFRDEMYYVACSRRLAWGYVDHPPFSIFILAVTRGLLGDSVVALRLPPAICASVTVFLTGWLTREAGGGRFAQALAMLAVVVSPVYLAVCHFYSMNALEVLLWTAAVCLFARLLRAPRPSLWLLLGSILGVGMLNKISVLWLVGGLTAGLLATPYRRLLLTPGPWLAFGLMALLFLPHIGWQVGNGWPTREFMHNATTQKMANVSPSDFVLTQILAMNPVSAPLWVGGMLWSLFGRDAGRWRVFGVMFLTVALLLVINGKSRANYLSPAYPALFAGGAAAFGEWAERRKLHGIKGVALAFPAVAGAMILPVVLPVLPVPVLVGYMKTIGFKPPQEEKGKPSLLPQTYADMFGWWEMAEAVAAVYHRLPPDEQQRCAIYASNYGEAGAIDYFGLRLGLPPAICSHNNYWLWGPGGWDGRTLIVLNTMGEDDKRQFKSVEQAGTFTHPYAMPYEQDAPIYLARGLKVPVAEAWRSAKNYR